MEGWTEEEKKGRSVGGRREWNGRRGGGGKYKSSNEIKEIRWRKDGRKKNEK